MGKSEITHELKFKDREMRRISHKLIKARLALIKSQKFIREQNNKLRGLGVAEKDLKPAFFRVSQTPFTYSLNIRFPHLFTVNNDYGSQQPVVKVYLGVNIIH